MNRPALYAILLLSAANILAGCATASSRNATFANSFERQSARALLADARSAIARGNVVLALPQLHEVVARHPGSPEALEAHYLLGKAYYDLDAYRDAIEELSRYLEAAPTGEHAGESRALMNRLSTEYRERFPSSEELDVEIASLRERWNADPASIESGKALADRLWLRGRYEEAGEVYLGIVRQASAFAQAAKFSQRVELRADGSYVLLTPTEITRREIERRPITVINLSSYRSGRDRRTQLQRYFVVTGQAVNRSEGLLRGVEIDITIYGFGSRIYDTSGYRIGDMHPGETRPFRVRFSDFRELNSIDRYDYSVRFRR